ncbi:MAG: PaaI family thioesterase [Chloroflexota bacterium]|nr:PaaI family thioesterase [Chloroflexota bacterium]
MIDERFARLEGAYTESPIHATLGLTLRVKAAGEVVITFDGSERTGNRSKVVAGGAIATMIDSAIVQAVRTLLDPADRTATVDLSVSFVRPGRIGRALSTTGRVDHLGRSLAVGRATTVDPDGEIVAVGLGTVSVRRVDQRHDARAGTAEP